MNVALRDAAGVLDLRGKVAVVTGAASGIGLALSRRLAVEGARVLMADVHQGALEGSFDRLRSLGLAVERAVVDVTDPAAVEDLARRAFALGPVGVVCLNAGVPGPVGEVWQVSIADWDLVLRVNTWGAIHGVRAFVPRLLTQTIESHVLFTISVAGLFTTPIAAPYQSSKHASYAIARILHDQLEGSRIRVSAICPGAVSTPLLESLRHGIREAAGRGALQEDQRVDSNRRTLEPLQVAAATVEAVGIERVHVLMNPEYRPLFDGHVKSVISEWPVPPTGDAPVRGIVDRLVASFGAGAGEELAACFRADLARGDAEPRGLAALPTGKVADVLRTARFETSSEALSGGSVRVRWRAMSRESGAELARGADVFSGDDAAIWNATTDHPLTSELVG